MSSFATIAGAGVPRRGPIDWPCPCGRPAELEKCGRTVCRTCAAALPPAREYPLRRNGWSSIQPGDFTLREQLGMRGGHSISHSPTD